MLSYIRTRIRYNILRKVHGYEHMTFLDFITSETPPAFHDYMIRRELVRRLKREIGTV